MVGEKDGKNINEERTVEIERGAEGRWKEGMEGENERRRDGVREGEREGVKE